jgi:hypothetical protein
VCLEYLERYFTLICFACYISGAHFPPTSPNALTFGEWLGGRPELRSILERLLRYNPAAALALNKSPDALADSEWRGGGAALLNVAHAGMQRVTCAVPLQCLPMQPVPHASTLTEP